MASAPIFSRQPSMALCSLGRDEKRGQGEIVCSTSAAGAAGHVWRCLYVLGFSLALVQECAVHACWCVFAHEGAGERK